MLKKKVTDLPIWKTLRDFWIFGANTSNESVRVDMGVVQDAIDDANAAAESCDTATKNAVTATEKATDATTAANNAATSATDAAGQALQAVKDASEAGITEAAEAAKAAAAAAAEAAETANAAAELAAEAASLVPTSMDVDWPETITLSNLVQRYVSATLYPEGTMQNVIFISDNKAVEVAPDGAISIVAAGTSKIYVIPTCNTALAKTITITVIERSLRMVTKSSMRLTASGALRFN